jgi:hypothetical protein
MSSLFQSNYIKCKCLHDSLGMNDKRAWRNPFSVIITGFYSLIKCTVLIAEGAHEDFEKQIKMFLYILYLMCNS